MGTEDNSVDQGQGQNQTQTREITIRVKDSDSNIEGASVTIGSTTQTTGNDGICSFTGISDGSISISVTATGYENGEAKTFDRTVSESTTSFILTLTKTAGSGNGEASGGGNESP